MLATLRSKHGDVALEPLTFIAVLATSYGAGAGSSSYLYIFAFNLGEFYSLQGRLVSPRMYKFSVLAVMKM